VPSGGACGPCNQNFLQDRFMICVEGPLILPSGGEETLEGHSEETVQPV